MAEKLKINYPIQASRKPNLKRNILIVDGFI